MIPPGGGLWPVPCVTCRRTPILVNHGESKAVSYRCAKIPCWVGPQRTTKGAAAAEWNRLMDTTRNSPKRLRELSDTVLVYLDAVDARFGPDQTIPRDASSALAKLTGWLDMANDRIRHFTLKLGISGPDKKKAVERLKQKGVI